MNTFRHSLITLASVFALAAAGSACAQDKPSDIGANVDVIVSAPPPAPKAEKVPPAEQGKVWLGGYWAWTGGNHGHFKWIPGRYEAERAGYRWQAHEWQKEPDGRYRLHGGWLKG